MIRTIEAIVDEHGVVSLLENIQLPAAHRAFVTILDEIPTTQDDSALLSEASLAEDWNKPEEDLAWAYLQQAQ